MTANKTYMRPLIEKVRKNKNLTPLACALVLTLTSGCMTRMADCTVASTKNVKLSKLDIDSLPRTKGVEGESVQPMFFCIPLSGPPNIKDALDDALAKGNGDLMVDPVFYQGGWWFIFGENVISVKGEVVNTGAAN
jgi:hypothetical protein